MTNITFFVITFGVYFLIWFWFNYPANAELSFKGRAKIIVLLVLFCVPFNINGTIFTVLGNAENPNGSILSVFSLYQNASEDAFAFCFAGYQRAGEDAKVGLGIAGYQDSGKNAVVGFGIAGYQKAERDAKVGFGIAGYQDSGKNAEVIVGVAGYQKARKDALVLGGIVGYQKAGHSANSFLAITLLQEAGNKSRAFSLWSETTNPDFKNSRN